ncbi:hypothetical protein [Mucilaginibacter lacusdianchii]|uniref:hypothetical protein n=1 Tax=Mucilaginibacter lacusdianchii TaxID=2684211 RepID=UPI00131BB83E|nr:hypothetical protein [Mucilaginibacter sp. JXJ CY 39]
MEFRLHHDYILKVEPEKEKPNKVRLIVKQLGKELVCRKESLNPLFDFIYGGDGRLFKGRLQLSKTKNAISVYINGDIIGTIEARIFQEGMNNL